MENQRDNHPKIINLKSWLNLLKYLIYILPDMDTDRIYLWTHWRMNVHKIDWQLAILKDKILKWIIRHYVLGESYLL